MNRLKDSHESLPDPVVAEDYYVIETFYDSYAVSRQTADAVARQLSRHPAPRWLLLRDLSTAFHRILAGHVYCIRESTARQRAAARAFSRARRLEAKTDRRSWEEDD